MIGPAYVQIMGRYNDWQNQQMLAVCDELGAEARAQNRGAFFGSIGGTLSHLLWGDTIWMSRFDGWAPPDVGIPGSADWVLDWQDFCDRRRSADAAILDWAAGLTEADLTGRLAWFSGALNQQVERPLGICVMHMFNHQTHHRGQIHAMLTAAGGRPADTDLFMMPGLA